MNILWTASMRKRKSQRRTSETSPASCLNLLLRNIMTTRTSLALTLFPKSTNPDLKLRTEIKLKG